MLNLFPTMFLSLLAHALLRVFVGALLCFLGYRHIGRDRKSITQSLNFKHAGALVWVIGTIELAGGILFIVGALTQAAAIAAALLALFLLIYRRRFAHPAFPGTLFYLLLLAASLSLFITGAGAFAFDLPL